ncbi:hypothetical protein HK096_004806 [Nowakowskiella sp. JEL0078]|nr:hypothetical protein HK096_004806 [Nowakowskiella sp. JEL0078]
MFFLSRLTTLLTDNPPKFLLWDTYVDRLEKTSTCSQFPLFSTTECSNFDLPPVGFSTSLPNVSSFGSSNCSGYDYSGPENVVFKPGNTFFPLKANGTYLLYSDGLVRQIGAGQSIRAENNNELGKMCMPRPSTVGGKITNQFYMQGFLADGQCYPMKTDNNTISYWQATCITNTTSANSTKILKYSCSDTLCTQNCQILDVSDKCAGACVNVSDYRNTPMFGWGSPLLNAMGQLTAITISSNTDSQNGTVTSPNTATLSSTPSQSSDSSIVIVAVSVGGSVIILAVSVIVASIIISKRRKQKKIYQGSMSSITNSNSSSFRSGSSMKSDSEISTKAVVKARRQYKNAVKEARRQQNYTNSSRSSKNRDPKLDIESKQSSNSPQSQNFLTGSTFTQKIDDESIGSRVPLKTNDIAMMEFPFRSDSDISSEKINERTPTPNSVFDSLERTHQKIENETSSLFYENAFIAATQAAQAASMAAAMAASAASNAVNFITIAEKRRKSKPSTENMPIEFDSLGASTSSNVVVSTPDKAVPDMTDPVFGTPESQYGILGNTSTSDFFPNVNASSLQSIFSSIPPIIMASETTSTKTKFPDGTETTTTVAKSMNTIGGNTGSGPVYTTAQLTEGINDGKMIVGVNKSSLQKTIAIAVHFAGSSNEIDLVVGDIIRMVAVGPVWSVGINLRTGSEGKFPSKCVVLQ